MPKNVICLLTGLLSLLSGNPARADERYTFDKKHTSILFSVGSLGVFHLEGKFSDYDGDFVFCVRHPDKDAVAITIYPASLHTSAGEMDDDLRGPDFFNTTQYPRMRFVSTAVKLLDKDNAKITGSLTLLGITKPVTVDAHLTEKKHDPKSGDYVAGFSASAVIKRSDFGMTRLIPIVGDEVSLRIQVSGYRSRLKSTVQE
jgi:polyisoprenoid-binding protein YceI